MCMNWSGNFAGRVAFYPVDAGKMCRSNRAYCRGNTYFYPLKTLSIFNFLNHFLLYR